LIFDYQGSLTEELIAHKFMKRDGKIYRFFKSIETNIIKSVDIILVNTEKAKQELANSFGIICLDDLAVSPK